MAEVRGNEEFERLRRVYRGMGDAELVGMGESSTDLTPAAREALTAELRDRGLDVPQGTAEEVQGGAVGLPTAGDLMPSNLGATGPEMELTTFYDAMAAGRACEFLEEAGIPFHVADLAQNSGLGTLEGGPAVALRLTVPLADVERAKGILRKKMGLFPLQEVEAADEVLDDGTRTVVGSFGTRAEAERAAGILTGAGFENRVLENAAGSEAEEDRYSVEVREVDLFAAGDALDKGLGVES